MERYPSSSPRNSAWTLLRDLIENRTGLYFDDNMFDLLMDKLNGWKAERNIDLPIDYHYLLKYEGQHSGEWSSLANAISVRETYFWREADQIRALVNTVVPELSQTGARPIRIWSAASASGEEPLSIAM